jgi:N-acyl-D-amino-acid deacylase
MRDPHPTWENLLELSGGGDGILLLEFKTPALKPLAGERLSQVAKSRGDTSEEAAIDLVVEDGSRVEVAYFLMSEENTRRQIALPWVSFDSDSDAPAPEGIFLKSSRHPRTYGNFARLLAKYVREEHVISLQEAIRRLTSIPADTLALKNRGRLQPGNFADVVIFDPKTIQDHATYENPAQLATGVDDVWINGIRALKAGEATDAHSGRVVRGRAWRGWPDGGCRKSARDWTWAK